MGSLYAADAAAAVSSSFLVSPLITIVDRSIMQNASGAMKMGDSVRCGSCLTSQCGGTFNQTNLLKEVTGTLFSRFLVSIAQRERRIRRFPSM